MGQKNNVRFGQIGEITVRSDVCQTYKIGTVLSMTL